MHKIIFWAIISCSMAGWSQEKPSKTYLDFVNESTIIYPGCEDAVNKAECLSMKVGELIAAAINERHKTEPFADALIKIKITLRSEASGALLASNIETNDSLAVAIAGIALERLPSVKPFTDESGDNVASTHNFIITLQRDYHTNAYVLVQNTKTHEWLKMPHPFVVQHAVFEGCVPEDKFLSQCFWEHFNVWRAEALETGNFAKFAGQKARLVIQVSADGIAELYTVEGPPKLRTAVEKAAESGWGTFPKMLPATLNGQLSHMNYTIPITF